MTGRSDAGTGVSGAREAGFTLLEVLAAFVVFAVTLGALLQVFSAGLRDAQLADEYARALMIAQSQLDDATATERLTEGSATGETAAFRWTLETTAYDERQESAEAQTAPEFFVPSRLLKLESVVRWRAADGRDRNVRLVTLHLAPRQ